ncbi:hypothetical protein PC128_g6724 [Phytophthora cactorum]|nr:hypothetical protein PC128_g6724 [Phytophthora cactorum]
MVEGFSSRGTSENVVRMSLKAQSMDVDDDQYL